MYTRLSASGDQVYIPVFVDDLMLVADSMSGLHDTKEDLKAGYKLKELGEISVYLGIQITRDKASKTISLGLPNYISGLEKKYEGHLKELGTQRGEGSPMVPDIMRKVKSDNWTDVEAAEVS